MERDPDPSTSHPEEESEAIEVVYPYRVTGDRSSNLPVTLQEHDQALRHILQLSRSHGLALNMKKSRLNLLSVTFFGKVFSSEGISPDPNKVAALQAAGPPQSQAEVRSFLFSAGANVDFMEGFSQTTAPLRDLINQGAPFQWTPRLVDT